MELGDNSQTLVWLMGQNMAVEREQGQGKEGKRGCSKVNENRGKKAKRRVWQNILGDITVNMWGQPKAVT